LSITTEDLIPEVARAARSATRSWTGALDAEDIANAAWVKILASSNTLPALLSYEPDQRGKVLRAIARQCAGAEMADREAFSGNVTYSTDDVRRILENGGAGDTPGSTAHVEWVDAQTALGQISPWHAEVLHAYYVRDDYDSSTNTAKSHLLRARDALTVAMNSAHKAAKAAHDGPGARRAVSNSAAQSLTRFEGGAQ
jgi:DNA-directed RNA polymerase specialized sigma24 family protein